MERSYQDYKEIIDAHLLDFIPNIDNKSISLYESMKYSLTAGGNVSGRFFCLPHANLPEEI